MENDCNDINMRMPDGSHKSLGIKKGYIISETEFEDKVYIKILNNNLPEEPIKGNDTNSAFCTERKKLNIIKRSKLISQGKNKLKYIDHEKCISNLENIKTIRNALAHNMRITATEISTFKVLKEEFYSLFSHRVL